MKSFGKFVLFIICAAAFYAVMNYLEPSQQIGILFAVLLIFMSHSFFNLSEKIGVDAFPKSEWIQKIKFGNPIIPKHEKSKGIPESGWGITEGVKLFYQDFSYFADVLNDWLKDTAWRVQEKSETEIGDMDGPSYGRQYNVFYNHNLSGKLSIEPLALGYIKDSEVCTNIEIEQARVYSYSDLMQLFSFIASLVATSEKGTEQARSSITHSMLTAIWEAGPDAIHNPDLEISLIGSAEIYLGQVKSKIHGASAA